MISVSMMLCLLSLAAPQDVEATVPQAAAMKMFVYDVTHLSRVTHGDLGVDSADLADLPSEAIEEVEEKMDRLRTEEIEALGGVIRRHIVPAYDHELHAIQTTATGVIAFHGTVAQHAWIKEFLAQQRAALETIYAAEVRIVEVPKGASEKLGLTDLPAMLDDQQSSALLAKLLAHEGSEIVQAPTVSVFGRQKAALSVLRQVAYVSRWERHENVAPVGDTIVDPVVEVVQEGLTTTCRITGVDEELLDLDIEVQLAEIVAMPEIETELGLITVPEVGNMKVRTRCALASGQTVVFSGLDKGEKAVLILARVTVVEPERHEVPEGGETKLRRER